ncbi:protein yellow [Drosophila guanche]|uniref:Blast:Protein yellow n=1 Tax=Drosophila guanche TaxID=7266 RepID=A0A3B0J1G2_DROGU|nr:protein yellow [Drosophila guanche]SPP74757.1 blast:Protein yellow [Drosophila guanche]
MVQQLITLGVCFSFWFLLAAAAQHAQSQGLDSVFQAYNLELAFPSQQERERVLREGLYDPANVIPIDVDVYYKHGDPTPSIFVTIPRFAKGVPYSLAYVTNEMKPNGTLLHPYPSYEWHKTHGADCNGLTSVYRTQIDDCGRLWILDSGEIDFVQLCAPQLYAIDLESGQVVHQYRMPKRLYKEGVSRFVAPTIELDSHNCDVGFVYMADSIGDGIVVYDVAAQQSWRIENKYTYPHPDFGTFTIAGESFQLWDGTVSTALTPHALGVKRMLYFHSLSSDWQMAIPLDVVNNGSNWKLNDVSAALDQFVVLGKRGSQCVASAMSETGMLLCGLVKPASILAWNTQTAYTHQNLVMLIEDEERLQFTSGLKIVRNHEGKEELWALSNRLQKAFGAGLNFKEINFRIQKCGVQELLNGGPCY